MPLVWRLCLTESFVCGVHCRYFREWGGGLCVGGFEPNAKPIFSKEVPTDFAFRYTQAQAQAQVCVVYTCT